MTYAGLALVFLAVAALTVLVTSRVVGLSRRWWAATAVVVLALLVLTAVFDSLMIAADLFRYDTDALLGPRVLRVPVEDFAWPLVAVLGLPALWELLGPSKEQGSRDD